MTLKRYEGKTGQQSTMFVLDLVVIRWSLNRIPMPLRHSLNSRSLYAVRYGRSVLRSTKNAFVDPSFIGSCFRIQV